MGRGKGRSFGGCGAVKKFENLAFVMFGSAPNIASITARLSD